MEEQTSTDSGVSLVKINLPDFANTAAKNLTDKPTQSVGQTLSDLWQIVFGSHLSYAAEKLKIKYAHDLEVYRKKLEDKISAIPEEKQTVPSLQIAGQALEDSKYCAESEELQELFSSLIANSMNIDYSNKVHPSFSKIIQQMSPVDAQMIKLFRQWRSSGGIAIVNYVKRLNKSEFEPIIEFVPAVIPDNCPVEAAVRSIISLQRLGLIQIPPGTDFSDTQRYTCFFETEMYSELYKRSKIFGFKLDTQRHLARLTPLGEDFVSACLD